MRAALALLALLIATASIAGAQGLQPLVIGWEEQFRIEVQSADRGGRPLVSGTVRNIAPWGAKKIQLLVEALDATGQPVNQRVIWLGIDLAGGSHAFFETPMPPAASYRVRVYAFDSGRGGRWS